MESLHLASVLVLLCLTHNVDYASMLDDSTSKSCQMRYCNDMAATTDIEIASANMLQCKCDDSCWRRQDCCLNYLNKTNVDDRTHYFGIPKADIERGQLYECQHLNPNETFYGVSMISKCGVSDNVNDELWQWQKSLCEQPIRYGNYDDLLLRVPVSSYVTGETYRNIYCAACHNDLDNIATWNTSAICYGSSSVSNLTEALQRIIISEDGDGPACHLKIEPQPEIKTDRCITVLGSFIRHCPPSYVMMSTSPEDMDRRREIEWLCQVTRGFVYVNGTEYDSLYCAACHLNETDIGAVIQLKHGICFNIYRSGDDMSGPLSFDSFAVLLDVNIFSKRGNEVGVTKRCSSGYIFDTFTEKCRTIVCSNVQHYHDGKCQLGHHNSSLAKSNLNCTTMQIGGSGGVVNDNGTLTVNHRKLYPVGYFEIVDNDTIYVCGDLNDNNTFDFRDNAHMYTTVICILLSLIALSLKMMIFVLISEIRKFSDRPVFCLSSSLFTAQLIFLTPFLSITDYPVCASIGVLTHYFYLCSFCWMNVLAYDIWNSLSRCIESRLIHADILKSRFYCYSMYAWVTPMLIVSAACVFEWAGIVDESSIMRPKYGVRLCWISRMTALIFYFAIPMALLLLTNIILFILTAVSICRSSRATSMVQSTEHSQNRSPHHLRFSLYVKLAVIMGLTWITGFVASYSGQMWLWYVFILSSASQGIYIYSNCSHSMQTSFPNPTAKI